MANKKQMPRTTEFMKRSEARIIMYLGTAEDPMKNGSRLAHTLKIDYAYLMKLLTGMYNKGWIITHKFNGLIYFNINNNTPIKEAKERLIDEQTTLETTNDITKAIG